MMPSSGMTDLGALREPEGHQGGIMSLERKRALRNHLRILPGFSHPGFSAWPREAINTGHPW